MRKPLLFVALWFAAGAVAMTIALAGVAVVSDQLSSSGGSRPAPLSAAEVRAEVAEADAAAGSTTTTPGSEQPSPTSTTTTTRPTPPPSTTTTRPSTTGTASDGSTTTTVPAPASVTRSYHLVGGDVTFRFSPSGVVVVVATPAAGFTVDVDDGGGDARVEFESDSHKSRIDAWWDGGPQTEVREGD